MSSSIEIEIGDDTYELDVIHFEAPSPYRWNEPPDGGEIELDDSVILVHGSDLPYSERQRERIPMERFLDAYAADRGVQKMSRDNTRAAAHAHLDEECFEIMMGRLEDDFDDREV